MTRGKLTYTVGNEKNPSNPHGRSVLVLDPTGAARLDHHVSGGGHTAFTGTAVVAVLDRVWAGLERAKFPNAPTQVMSVGSTIRILAVEIAKGKKETAHIEWHAATQFAGYAEAFALLDGMIRQLSGNTVERVAASTEELVTNVKTAK
jgi:hypothetical protein